MARQAEFHYKVANQLCDEAGIVFAEDFFLKAMSKGMLCKHKLDAGFGQFLSIFEYICWKNPTTLAISPVVGMSRKVE